MNAFDFLSDSPRTYIFHKRSNKTNLGGVLTFIYIIILLLLILVYLFDYFKNYYKKFEISYFYNQFLDENVRNEKKKDPKCNPLTDFSFKIQNEQGEILSQNFTIYLRDRKEKRKGEIIKMGENISKKPDDFTIVIAYNCLDDCTFKSKEIEDLLDEEFTFIISYNSKLIDNDNEDSPVIDTILNYTHYFYLDAYFFGLCPIWEVYNYEEKKGIFERMIDFMNDKEYIHTFGQMKDVKVYDLSREIDDDIEHDKETGKYYKSVLGLSILNPLEGIHKYKRNSVSIWDYLANIASLGIGIFNGFCKVFTLIYSKNFDNYKIIENLLSKQFIKQYEFNNIENIPNSENNDKQTKNNERIFSNEDLIINDVDENTEYILENEDDKMVTKLPKLTFFDFIFNNIYSNLLWLY